jgi:hypothetical protein
MDERDENMIIQPVQVFDAVEREVSVDREIWTSRDIKTEIEVPADMAAMPLAGDPCIDYSLEHVFTLLSLTLDRDALILSKQAILSSDRNLRGTALEYLENVLPDNVRNGLWPHFGEVSPSGRPHRARKEVVADLEGSGPREP